MPKTNEREWENDYKKLIVARGVEISAHGIFVIRDFIRQLEASTIARCVEVARSKKMLDSLESPRCGCPSMPTFHNETCEDIATAITSLGK